MTDQMITDLTAVTSLTSTDVLPLDTLVVGVPTTKKITVANIIASLKTLIPTDTLAALTDITVNNASTSAHGFLKKLSGTATDVLRGDGTFGNYPIDSLSGKTTPADADETVLADSASSFTNKKLTFTNLKAFLKTYFDTLYAGINSATWTTVKKTADETIASSTVLHNDNALSISLAASTKYSIRGKVYFDTGPTEDMKFRFQHTGTFTQIRGIFSYLIPGTTALTTFAETSTTIPTSIIMATGAGSSGGYIDISLAIVNNAAGTLSFQWAQNTSGVANTTVSAGSYLEYTTI